MEPETIISTHCYCCSVESDFLMLKCTSCRKKFHLNCLKTGRPSDLMGDIYFKMICENCSPNGTEEVTRMKLQWTLVILIALYNLQSKKERGKCGYFRWRDDICGFINKHWNTFFGPDKKKSATWHGTVAGALSTGANRLFMSGLDVFGENGWWTLKSMRLPRIEELDAFLNCKSSRKSSAAVESPVIEGSRRKTCNVLEAALALKEQKDGVLECLPKTPRPKKKSVKKKTEDYSNFSPLKIVLSEVDVKPKAKRTPSKKKKVPKIIIKQEPTFNEDTVSQWIKQEIGDEMTFDIDSPIDSLPFPDPLDNSECFTSLANEIISDIGYNVKMEYESEEESSSSDYAKMIGGNKKMQQRPVDTSRKRKAVTNIFESPVKEHIVEIIPTKPKFTMMCPYEEEQLLKKLESFPTAMKEDSQVRRLYRKLCVRKLKREHNVPVFDIDAEVRAVRGMDPPEYGTTDSNKGSSLLVKMNQILDRFQLSHSNVRANAIQQTSFVMRLMGLEDEQLQSIVSPYTARVLKPFIFRDYETKPLRLRLLEEIVAYPHRSEPDWNPPQKSSIDYCYVRPQYIPGINALCQEFFWPGIDLSESLQYPDFSCVALYKKVIVGFAFMVPDVKYNEAYITFIFCHPEWRRCGIASFMLYHLIQTCMGKDITLHVSATNPAVFLYHKFGFKIEEFIHDFYDKYLPSDSKECRHAFFYRMSW